jgi:exosortase/archaeosortase family protein
MNARTLAVLLRPVAVVAVVVVTFQLCNAVFRQFEASAATGFLRLFGVSEQTVQTRPNSSIAVFTSEHGAFLAIVTPSCSSLASLLAIAFLAVYVPRRSRRRVPALAAALLFVLVGNVLRIAGSVAAGLLAGTGSLVLFHDWVGSLFAFGYTLGGYLLMLAVLLPGSDPDPTTDPTADPAPEAAVGVAGAR